MNLKRFFVTDQLSFISVLGTVLCSASAYFSYIDADYFYALVSTSLASFYASNLFMRREYKSVLASQHALVKSSSAFIDALEEKTETQADLILQLETKIELQDKIIQLNKKVTGK